MTDDEIQTLSRIINIGTQVATGLAVLQSTIVYKEASGFSTIILIKMLYSMKYISITFPTALQAVLSYQDSDFTSITFSKSFLVTLFNKFHTHELPENFQQDYISSTFLVNFWDSLMTILLALLVILLLIILEYCTRFMKNHDIFKVLKQIFCWNFSISLFLTYYNGIILYSSFEFRTEKFETYREIINFCVCILVNLFAIAIPIKAFSIGIQANRISKVFSREHSQQQIDDANKKIAGYEVIYTNIRPNSFFKHIYLFIFILRIYGSFAIISYLFEHPVVQLALMISLNLLMLLYYLILLPFKSWANTIFCSVQEVILLIVNVCLLLLADYTDSSDETTNNRIGYVIIYSYVVFVLFGSLWIFLKLVIEILRLLSNDSAQLQVKKTNLDISQNNMSALPLQNQIDLSSSMIHEKSPALSKNLSMSPKNLNRGKKRESSHFTVERIDLSKVDSQRSIHARSDSQIMLPQAFPKGEYQFITLESNSKSILKASRPKKGILSESEQTPEL